MISAAQPNGGQADAAGPGPTSGAKKIIQLIGDLPAMPHIAAQVMQALAKPNSTPWEIHDLIVKDQSLAARVLKVANSPYYGASRSVSTIKQAIIFMGFDSIASLVMTAVMKDMIAKDSQEGKHLWKHSICCAVAAKYIGGVLGFQRLEEAFLAGLMHDIGKSVLFLQVPGKMRDIALSVNGKQNSLDAERELLGFTHTEVGRLLAQKWRLPLAMEEVLANHHEPDGADYARELVHVVSIANSLCHKLGIGLTKRPLLDPYELESVKVLGLGDAAIATALKLLAEIISSEEEGDR